MSMVNDCDFFCLETRLNWIREAVSNYNSTPFFHLPTYSAWPIFILPQPSSCPLEKWPSYWEKSLPHVQVPKPFFCPLVKLPLYTEFPEIESTSQSSCPKLTCSPSPSRYPSFHMPVHLCAFVVQNPLPVISLSLNYPSQTVSSLQVITPLPDFLPFRNSPQYILLFDMISLPYPCGLPFFHSPSYWNTVYWKSKLICCSFPLPWNIPSIIAPRQYVPSLKMQTACESVAWWSRMYPQQQLFSLNFMSTLGWCWPNFSKAGLLRLLLVRLRTCADDGMMEVEIRWLRMFVQF